MIASLYEPFKKWAEKGSVWIISDPHFDDEDTAIMNPNWMPPQVYVVRLNRIIFKNDTLVCLGDCGNPEWFKKLKAGRKVLIKGNHDDGAKNKYTEIFDEVYEGPLFISDRILLSHEPIKGLPFCYNIHGHVHNSEYEYLDSDGCKHINLAADVVEWLPFNLGTAIKQGLLSNISTIHRIAIDRAKKHGYCEKCKYYEHEDIDNGYVCVNDKSEHLADWVEPHSYCSAYIERDDYEKRT